jgi:hypothetical protein
LALTILAPIDHRQSRMALNPFSFDLTNKKDREMDVLTITWFCFDERFVWTILVPTPWI